MLINEQAGSGGDYLPYAFRQSGLGPLIGKRTWGGLVGIGGYPPLVDGGGVTAPRWGIWFPNGKWEVENRGVAPDMEVEFDPKAVRAGKDPQLQGDRFVLDELKKHPVEHPPRPPFPNYYKPGGEGAGRREVIWFGEPRAHSRGSTIMTFVWRGRETPRQTKWFFPDERAGIGASCGRAERSGDFAGRRNPDELCPKSGL